MDQMTINFLAGGAFAALGWFARTLYDQQQAHSKELADFKVKVATEYVPNTAMERVMDEVRRDLRYIRDRVDEIPQRRQEDQT